MATLKCHFLWVDLVVWFCLNVNKHSGRNVCSSFRCIFGAWEASLQIHTHKHTHIGLAGCMWTTGLRCAVFRRRDCTSTKCLACSPPAPRSCVLTSTWTWHIAKTGTNMSKVEKTPPNKQNRPYWFLCLETTLKTTLKCFIHHQHASHSILQVKCCSSSSVVPFCSH